MAAEQMVAEYIAEAFGTYSRRRSVPEIRVCFYPFVRLNNTIWLRDSIVRVRISDILADAPADVLRALAFILVADLYRRRAAKRLIRLFEDYVECEEVVVAIARIRRERERLTTGSHQGEVYNLKQIFARLNRQYFGGGLRQPRLSWSRRRRLDLLGWYDQELDEIVISRLLDEHQVPGYAICYVLYHEMLHLRHPMQIVNGRCHYHTPAFRQDELKFDRYEDALKALLRLR